MAQISSLGSSPDQNSAIQTGPLQSGPNTSAPKALSASLSGSAQTDEAQPSPLQAQLTRLSSVLSGLQKNAAATRAQYVQAQTKIKSGSYSVDALGVSRSLVNDMLTRQ
jgi:anti-sigma28 factor (negative regulator of flagellin synthesis)